MSEENKSLEDVQQSVVEELEQTSLKELDALREENNTENEKVVEDAKKKLSDIFEELSDLIKENSDPDKIKENLSMTRSKVVEVLQTTKDKVIEVSNSEHFQQTVDAGKDLLEGSVGLISDGFKAGADLLMSNDNISDLVNKANARLDVLRDSDGLKKGVDAAEQLTNKMNKAVFGGLQKFFDGKKEDDDTQ